METAQTLRVVAEKVTARIVETGVDPAEVAKVLAVHPSKVTRPGELSVAELVHLSLILGTEPGNLFPDATPRTGSTQ